MIIKYKEPSGPLKPAKVLINGQWVELESNGDGTLSAGGREFKVNTKPLSITKDLEIVVTPKGNRAVNKEELKTKVGYSSAFNGNDIMVPIKKGFELLGQGLYAGALGAETALTYGPFTPLVTLSGSKPSTPVTNAIFKYGLPYASASKWIGWARTGYAPHREENTGLGDEDTNLLFDLGASPIFLKGIGKVLKYSFPTLLTVRSVARNSTSPFNFRNYKFLLDNRFYSDINKVGSSGIREARRAGEYPLTFTERRNFINNFKLDVSDGLQFAKQEAVETLKVPLRRLFLNPNPQLPSDIFIPEGTFGTSKYVRRAEDFPDELGITAFKDHTGVYFPFRGNSNTLLPIEELIGRPNRLLVGAHEGRHFVLDQFRQPLTIYKSGKWSEGEFPHPNLPESFKTQANDFISDAGTTGEWQGNIKEWDAELAGWRAKYGYPRYSEMTSEQKATIRTEFLKRFGNNIAKDLMENYAIAKEIGDYGLYDFVNEMNHNRIDNLIQSFDNLGYRKQGGTINKKYKRR